MSYPLNHQHESGCTTQASVKTIYLFGMLSIASMALVWANNEFVMTKEVLFALAGNPHNTILVDAQYETVRFWAAWGYAVAPLQTALRIGFVALIVQITCLLGGSELPYGRLFRISTVAFGATLFGSLLQILWIARQPVTAVMQVSLGFAPDSLAAWFGTTSTSQPFLQLVLGRVSITSLLWMLLLYWGLRETNRLRIVGAVTVTGVTWCVISAVQIGTSLFVQNLVS